MTSSHILLCDDQPDVLHALRLLLKSEGFTCEVVATPEAALEALSRTSFAVALVDLNYTRDTTSGKEGIDLLERMRALDSDLPVVVMTAWAAVGLVVEAMRRGAVDFIEKPWDNRRLISVLRTQIDLSQSRKRERVLTAENRLLRENEGDRFIAEAPSMRPVMEMIRRVAPSDAHVLILGENGTGKGVVARQIHRLSRRSRQPLIKVNMGGIPENLFESEMFGHVRGAFTDAKGDRIGRFELADGGSLFLDEVANIPLSQQPKLLRVLEDGELERVGSSQTIKVSARVISATNANLIAEVTAGRFRKDLLFRLNTVEIRLPPLRERREDIAAMAEDLLSHFVQRYHRDPLRLSTTARRALETYHWPGNIRELAHLIERAVLMTRGEIIEGFDFNSQWPEANSSIPASNLTLDQVEQSMVRHALDQYAGNIQKAAEVLGLSRAALYRRMEKFGLRTERVSDNS